MWAKFAKYTNNTKKKIIFSTKTIFSNRPLLFRWTFALNVAAFLGFLAFGRKQINPLITHQTQIFSDVQIPQFLRRHVYGAYCKWYGVNVDEIELPYKQYTTFSQFFTRKITRRVADASKNCVSSPCDGKIISCSEVTQDQCQIIKNSHYLLSQLVLGDSHLLGPNESIQQFLRENKQNKLYQLVIYLGPEDYHRFHTPVDLRILKKKQIAGGCEIVNESALQKGKPIYEKNARVTVFSEWEQGLLTMVMVGALNVTRIHVNDGLEVNRGQQLGYFNLGSTIVMIVQTKGVKQFKVKQGDKVQYGQALFQYIP